ncbi:MAG TPA: ATP-binding protein [Candidatus Sulfopaludibacter sp.]|nr:ATP-binding protein [Candidatus Sulfopaludibacter sp.]
MQTTISTEKCGQRLPFIGRKRETAQLRRLHAQHKHTLVLGPAGVGKSALVTHLAQALPLLVCPQSETLGEICGTLEMELAPNTLHLPLVQRKNRLLQKLAETHRTVVFDGVGWTTPKISSFLESAMERATVWICTRSELARNIGHFWPLLARFEIIKLRAFHTYETQALLNAAIDIGQIPSSLEPFARQLHRLAAGLPRTSCEFLEQFAAGHYDLSRRTGWQLLDTDRRIKNLSLSAV